MGSAASPAETQTDPSAAADARASLLHGCMRVSLAKGLQTLNQVQATWSPCLPTRASRSYTVGCLVAIAWLANQSTGSGVALL